MPWVYSPGGSIEVEIFVVRVVFCVSVTTEATEVLSLSLHDALPISAIASSSASASLVASSAAMISESEVDRKPTPASRSWADRKSTRLNSSHTVISYAVLCLKNKRRSLKVQVIRNHQDF